MNTKSWKNCTREFRSLYEKRNANIYKIKEVSKMGKANRISFDQEDSGDFHSSMEDYMEETITRELKSLFGKKVRKVETDYPWVYEVEK